MKNNISIILNSESLEKQNTTDIIITLLYYWFKIKLYAHKYYIHKYYIHKEMMMHEAFDKKVNEVYGRC